jgi:hypothetical protein
MDEWLGVLQEKEDQCTLSFIQGHKFLKRMQKMYSGFVNLPRGKKLNVKNQSWYIRSKAPPVMAL